MLIQNPCFNELQELLRCNSTVDNAQIEVLSQSKCSIEKFKEDAIKLHANQFQNVLVWTRLATGDLQDVVLPQPQCLQLLDFQQILIAKKNLIQIAGYDWVQKVLHRVNFFLNHVTDLTDSEIQTLQQVSLVLKEISLNFQYENTKQVVEQTLESVLQSMETKDYQKIGINIYSAAANLNKSSPDCIGYVMKEVLDKQFGQGNFTRQNCTTFKPDVKVLHQNLQGIRKEFQHFKLLNCKNSKYSYLYGICYIFEVFLQKVEIGTQTEFLNERIELTLLRFLSMFFGLIRGLYLSNEMSCRGRTWKEYQMKYLVNVTENPDIAYLKQKRWEDSCINLSYPWNHGKKPNPGTKNAQMQEEAKRNIEHENFREKIEAFMGTFTDNFQQN